MSTNTAVGARLEDLRRRFESAAFEFPAVEAYLVFRPDLRRDEADRESRLLLVTSANPDSENVSQELLAETKSIHEAMRLSIACQNWMPSGATTIEGMKLQRYFGHTLDLEGKNTVQRGARSPAERWEWGLFGPKVGDTGSAIYGQFIHLAERAVELMALPNNSSVRRSVIRWLTHLVDEAETMYGGPPGTGPRVRWFLSWPTRGSGLDPIWGPVTPGNTVRRPARWWVARLSRVFHVSELVVGRAIESAKRPNHNTRTSQTLDKHAEPALLTPLEDPDERRIGKWSIRPGEVSFDGGAYFDVDRTHRKLLIRLLQANERTVSVPELKGACDNDMMETSTLRSHVCTLNAKLKKHLHLAANPITSVEGGYRFALAKAAASMPMKAKRRINAKRNRR